MLTFLFTWDIENKVHLAIRHKTGWCNQMAANVLSYLFSNCSLDGPGLKCRNCWRYIFARAVIFNRFAYNYLIASDQPLEA
jgi:hypothetical protein